MSKLSISKLRGLKPERKVKRYWDGNGLYLEMRPSGAKVFMLKYRVAGTKGKRKEKRITLGKFTPNPKADHLTLAQARVRTMEAKEALEEGRDPAVAKHVAKVVTIAAEGDTFQRVAMAWLDDEEHEAGWTPRYRGKVQRTLEQYVYPVIGQLPISEIRAAQVFPILQSLRLRTSSVGDTVEQRIRGVMDFAVYSGSIDINPLPSKRRRKKKGNNLPALLTLDALRQLLDEVESVNLSTGLRRSHLMLAFTCQRVSEVVGSTWDEIDFDNATWTVPRNRMKMKDVQRPDQVIPIPALLLQEMRKWRKEGVGRYLCPGADPIKHIGISEVSRCYRVTLGYRGRHSPHSWRSAFSTLAHDAGKDHMAIEAQLDHVIPGVAGVYDRGQRLEMRRDLMDWWESQLVG